MRAVPAYFEKYCMYKMQTDCDECGHPVILDGPARTVECTSCMSKLEFDADFWKGVMEDIIEEYGEFEWDWGRKGQQMGSHSVSYTYAKQVPKCRDCRTPLPLDTIDIGHDGPMACTKCGLANHTRPAPKWLKEVFGDALQMFCVPPSEAEALPASLPDELRPVLMACMNCGGKLEVNSDSSRVFNCEYCDSDHWLPEQLWRRFHPAKKKTSWYVGYGWSNVAPDYVPEDD